MSIRDVHVSRSSHLIGGQHGEEGKESEEDGEEGSEEEEVKEEVKVSPKTIADVTVGDVTGSLIELALAD